MDLQDWAVWMGVSYETAQRWFVAGKIPGARRNKRGVVVPDKLLSGSMVKLSTWAVVQGIAYKTAWRRYKRGEIAGAVKVGGTVLVPRDRSVLVMDVMYDRVDMGRGTMLARGNILYGMKKLLEGEHGMAGIKELLAWSEQEWASAMSIVRYLEEKERRDG